MRCILVLLIVFMHSFTYYNHGWCGFVLATIISYFLTVSLLRTKLGRFIIG